MTSDTDVTDAQNAGLLLGVAALIGELRRKDLLTRSDIDAALQKMAEDIRSSALAQAVPEDRLIAATLAPLEQMRRMNEKYDPDTGGFPGWMDEEQG
jgi:hypothetical protein